MRGVKKGVDKKVLYKLWRGDDFIVGGAPRNAATFIPLGIELPAFSDDARIYGKLRDIIETFLTLVFQSFQPRDLERWLDKSAKIHPGDHGANVSIPVLDQTTKARKVSWASLWHSNDPRKVAIIRAAVARGHKTQRAEGYKSKTDGVRESAASKLWQLGILRVPEGGEPTAVPVSCINCGTEHIDRTPAYATSTGEYIARVVTCFVCPVPDPPLAGRIYARGVFLPVEEMPHGFLRYDTLNCRLGNSKGCLKYYGQESLPSDSSAGSHQVPKFVAASSSQTLGGILRDADPKKGEPDSVTLKCKSCGRTRLDQVPSFLSYTGEYVWTSPYCFEPGCQKKSWTPVDALPRGSLCNSTMRAWFRSPLKRWEYTPEPLRAKTAPDAKPQRSRGLLWEEGILRTADPKKGDPTSVKVQCPKCKGEGLDTTPLFLNLSGQYVVTLMTCSVPTCESKSGWIPVGVKDSVVVATIKNRMKDPMNRWEHTPPHLRGPEPVPGEEKAKKPAKKPAAKKRLLSSRDDDDDDDEDDEDEVPREKARS